MKAIMYSELGKEPLGALRMRQDGLFDVAWDLLGAVVMIVVVMLGAWLV